VVHVRAFSLLSLLEFFPIDIFRTLLVFKIMKIQGQVKRRPEQILLDN